jgi:hypothetical protein
LQTCVWKLHAPPAALLWTGWQVRAVGSQALFGAHTPIPVPQGIPVAIAVAQVPQVLDVVPPSETKVAPISQRALAHCASLMHDWPDAREPGIVSQAGGVVLESQESPDDASTHAWMVASLRLEPGSAFSAAQSWSKRGLMREASAAGSGVPKHEAKVR